jgi:hypothetical protein
MVSFTRRGGWRPPQAAAAIHDRRCARQNTSLNFTHFCGLTVPDAQHTHERNNQHTCICLTANMPLRSGGNTRARVTPNGRVGSNATAAAAHHCSGAIPGTSGPRSRRRTAPERLWLFGTGLVSCRAIISYASYAAAVVAAARRCCCCCCCCCCDPRNKGGYPDVTRSTARLERGVWLGRVCTVSVRLHVWANPVGHC